MKSLVVGRALVALVLLAAGSSSANAQNRNSNPSRVNPSQFISQDQFQKATHSLNARIRGVAMDVRATRERVDGLKAGQDAQAAWNTETNAQLSGQQAGITGLANGMTDMKKVNADAQEYTTFLLYVLIAMAAILIICAVIGIYLLWQIFQGQKRILENQQPENRPEVSEKEKETPRLVKIPIALGLAPNPTSATPSGVTSTTATLSGAAPDRANGKPEATDATSLPANERPDWLGKGEEYVPRELKPKSNLILGLNLNNPPPDPGQTGEEPPGTSYRRFAGVSFFDPAAPPEVSTSQQSIM